MMVEALKKIFVRDLQKLRTEINSYKSEANIWRIDKQIANSAGNLCLHLVGNLNAFIGAEIGKSGYVRNRDLEFSLKNVPRVELVDKIDKTIDAVNHALSQLTDDTLENEYPQLVLAEKTSTGYFLLHLTVHLGYHLGQVNYHRRLLDE